MGNLWPEVRTTMVCPCKGCTDRKEACHDTCAAYKAWKEERDELVRRKIGMQREFEAIECGFHGWSVRYGCAHQHNKLFGK